MKRIISIFLVLALVISFPNTASASNNTNYQDEISELEIELARKAFYSLSNEAKTVFEQALQSDYEMLIFHITYVDPTFKIDNACIANSTVRPTYLTTDNFSNKIKWFNTEAATSISAQLSALDLPTSVLYSLNAMSAAMVAAVADGPLPIGDILLAAATASVVIVVAANWNSVAPKWSQIISIFKRSFAGSVNNIISAFSTIKSDIDAELINNPCVTVSETTITINGVAYRCTTDASYVAQSMRSQNHKYYPAVLSNNKVLVCPRNIERNIAIAIMSLNRRFFGVFALNSSYARGLCNSLGGARGPETHGSSEGYWYHYHGANFPLAHCWFFN